MDIFDGNEFMLPGLVMDVMVWLEVVCGKYCIMFALHRLRSVVFFSVVFLSCLWRCGGSIATLLFHRGVAFPFLAPGTKKYLRLYFLA
jgi:hypothetical protein